MTPLPFAMHMLFVLPFPPIGIGVLSCPCPCPCPSSQLRTHALMDAARGLADAQPPRAHEAEMHARLACEQVHTLHSAVLEGDMVPSVVGAVEDLSADAWSLLGALLAADQNFPAGVAAWDTALVMRTKRRQWPRVLDLLQQQARAWLSAAADHPAGGSAQPVARRHCLAAARRVAEAGHRLCAESNWPSSEAAFVALLAEITATE